MTAPTVNQPRIVWLGDDFTGAAASMEALAFSGLRAVLFLGQPDTAQLARFDGVEAFGIATMARSKSPEWMAENLPDLFRFLDRTGAGIVHYKICSTLDSAPHVGSIGKAAEIALGVFGDAVVPVVTAAPRLGRYQAFGSLFASAGAETYRLDRHPVMARHPVTPMDEADVARHLSRQTKIGATCLDLTRLADPVTAAQFLDGLTPPTLCTVDLVETAAEATVGRLIWDRRAQSRFVIGSQGVEYALEAHWAETGELTVPTDTQRLDPVDQIVAVSGSVSPTTAAQIDWAEANGFEVIQPDAVALAAGKSAEMDRAVTAALGAITNGQSALVTTARGPDDPAVAALRTAVPDMDAANARLGEALGHILREVLRRSGLTRAAVSGGDTSGHVCTTLGIYALEAIAPTIPGAAINRAHSESAFDGLEIALKGGQMGTADYFGWIRSGGGERA